MTKIILSGCFGRMGKTLQEMISLNENLEVIAGVDIALQSASFPVYQNISGVKEEADVIIDFSNPSCLNALLTAKTPSASFNTFLIVDLMNGCVLYNSNMSEPCAVT